MWQRGQEVRVGFPVFSYNTEAAGNLETGGVGGWQALGVLVAGCGSPVRLWEVCCQ